MAEFRPANDSVSKALSMLSGIAGNNPQASLIAYLTSFGGRLFDVDFIASNRASADSFTAADLRSIRHLSVSTTAGFDRWLLSNEGSRVTSELLVSISPSLRLEDISTETEFTASLGTEFSATSRLWNLLVVHLREFGQTPRQGIEVVASKLIAGKRPLLVPIADSFVREELVLNWSNCWFRYWQIMRDPDVVKELETLRSGSAVAIREGGLTSPNGDEVEQLSLVRVLDIVTWHFHWEIVRAKRALARTNP